MLLQWEPRSRGIHLVFGGLYAAALERYAHSRAEGASHDAATLRMVRWAMENSGERPHVTIETKNGEEIMQSVCINCNKVNDRLGMRELDENNGQCPNGAWAPWSPTEPEANIKNRYTLVRALVWNVEERATSPFTTYILANGKPAVELTFNFHAFELDGEAISLSGHLDEVISEPDGDLWVRDDKTSKHTLDASYFKRYTPDNQMSLYSFAGKIILDRPVRGVLVKAAQMAVGFSRFRTQPIPRPAAVLTEWFEDTKHWIGRARDSAITGHYPMNDKACFLCSFKSICAVSPSHRAEWLKQDYVKRVWNPLAARGDV